MGYYPQFPRGYPPPHVRLSTCYSAVRLEGQKAFLRLAWLSPTPIAEALRRVNGNLPQGLFFFIVSGLYQRLINSRLGPFPPHMRAVLGPTRHGLTSGFEMGPGEPCLYGRVKITIKEKFINI